MAKTRIHPDSPIFHILVDTSVWLDLARDRRQQIVIDILEQMLLQNLVKIVVPEMVLDEFRRNRPRILTESTKSVSSHVRVVKDAIGQVGGDKRRIKAVMRHLDDVSHKLPIVGGTAANALERIERFMTRRGVLVPTTDAAKLRAAQRAIDKRAPFHRERNSMADAVLIEVYAEYIQTANESGRRFAFVTHNKNDFSAVNTNQKLPHPDIAEYFSRVKSLYSINLPEILRRVDPSLVSDVMWEFSIEEEPRGRSEILKAEDLLWHQVWYNRHWNMRVRVERGDTQLVNTETYPRQGDTILKSVYEMALEAAQRVEQKYGKENLGPWDDFEWGMINGKLSALRWALGDEWDMLDT